MTNKEYFLIVFLIFLICASGLLAVLVNNKMENDLIQSMATKGYEQVVNSDRRIIWRKSNCQQE